MPSPGGTVEPCANPARTASQVIVASLAGGGSGAFSLAAEADLIWQLSLDGDPLTDEETEAAAGIVAGVVRIRGRWVVIDAETPRQARDRSAGRLTGAPALGAALTGQVTVGGRDVACSAIGRLADLLGTLRAAGSSPHDSFAVPDGLQTTLRRYQRIAVQWLVRTTAAGFGTLLADDMGLGKTLTVIVFRLARENTGQSLVVCPASLVVNWERESPGSHRASRSGATTQPAGPSTAWSPARLSSPPTGRFCETPVCSPPCPGTWSWWTRRSRSRTIVRRPPAHCGSCARRRGSR